MEKECCQSIIEEVSKKLSKKIISEEKDLTQRATLIDSIISHMGKLEFDSVSNVHSTCSH
jgi:hypothetical protein